MGADRFPVVGLGASAGGLQALEAFFSAMPADSGVAFVVVTHQHRGHTSMLPELLARRTAMPVIEASSPVEVKPDHIYTSSPGYNLTIADGVLEPLDIDARPGLQMPIDFFFRALARDQQEDAIGIVLSGTGSDGSLGLKEIKAELGMVMVQEEASAQYTGMPHSAIATDMVDYVLPVAAMPDQLLAYVKSRGPRADPKARAEGANIDRVLEVLRESTGHDFSQYKRNTLRRRIERRINVRQLDSIERYLELLEEDPGESELLFSELLIGVTSFFRDPEAWKALAPVIEDLLADKRANHVVRAWVPGCATGEEAYSLAIVLREAMDAIGRSVEVQIFATDLDGAAIEAARAGAFPAGITNDVSAERLARFFTREDDTFQVRKNLREMLVFAQQNLIGDPPFTKLDLLFCRNLLIYLEPPLQRRLIPLFHYALKPGGVLFLGSSESLGAGAELFEPIDKKWKIFRRRDVGVVAALAEFPVARASEHTAPARTPPPAVGLGQVVSRMLLDELVAPTVLVHERGDVIHVHGRTGRFLEPATGVQASANIFNMTRAGLEIPLAAALRQAATSGEEIIKRGVRVQANGDLVTFDLRVRKLTDPEPLRGLLRVTFDRPRPVFVAEEGEGEGAEISDEPRVRITELERELMYARESHQGTAEELETANEELKSTNEELQSTNEELQSANEELVTSKEELQSLNEELQTVNAELQGKVEELSRTNSDMKNLLNGTDIATVFLDNELRIKRYTEQARQVIRLIPTDIGRPISDLVSTLRYDRLVADARDVLRTLVFRETEVQDDRGQWYLLRILPYRTSENVIDGLVLTFVDVTRIKRLQAERLRLHEILASSMVSAFGMDTDRRVTWAVNQVFGQRVSEVLGKRDSDHLSAADAELLAELESRVLADGKPVRERVELVVGATARIYDLYWEPVRDDSGELTGLSCVAADITGR